MEQYKIKVEDKDKTLRDVYILPGGSEGFGEQKKPLVIEDENEEIVSLSKSEYVEAIRPEYNFENLNFPAYKKKHLDYKIKKKELQVAEEEKKQEEEDNDQDA